MALSTDPSTGSSTALSTDSPAARTSFVTRREALRGALLGLGVVLLGAPVGILWATITPRAELTQFDNGVIARADPYDEAFIGVHLYFLGVTALAGLLVGVTAWFLGRRWAIAALLGAVVGAALAAAIALKTGQVFDARLGSIPDGTREVSDGFPLTFFDEDGDPSTAGPGYSPWLVLGWPAGVSLAFAAMAFWRIGPPDPNEPVSSGTRSASRSRR